MSEQQDLSTSAILSDFAVQWAEGRYPEIRAFVDRLKDATDDQRRELLIQLISVDIDCRWALDQSEVNTVLSGSDSLPIRPLLDDYSQLFPELEPLSSLPPALIEKEFAVRTAHAAASDVEHGLERTTDLEVVLDKAEEPPLAETQSLAASPPEDPSVRPRQIGPYALLRMLGEGGMGTVWLAEQLEPIRRRVAIKLIRTNLDHKQVVARFESERQVLALMDHPNIAKVLDAGMTEIGTPYYVMELVEGMPITKFCDANWMGIKQRLHLFIQACDAIQHAHQKGIIHRDIKPSNVLVAWSNGTATVKVIDFGLAKALEPEMRPNDQTRYTEFGQVLGTVRYMSPEQAGTGVLDIDTRSDIYSLGVLLYELLVETTPLESEAIKALPLDKVLAAIREQEPQIPSKRLLTSKTAATIAERRLASVSKLRRMLEGDFDWIVMKALEKEPDRRYGSASDLADDVQRFLNGEMILARPPSLSYKILRASRKKRTALVVAVCIGAFIVAGAVMGSVLTARVTEAERRTIIAEQKVRQIAQERDELQLGADRIAMDAKQQILKADERAKLHVKLAEERAQELADAKAAANQVKKLAEQQVLAAEEQVRLAGDRANRQVALTERRAQSLASPIPVAGRIKQLADKVDEAERRFLRAAADASALASMLEQLQAAQKPLSPYDEEDVEDSLNLKEVEAESAVEVPTPLFVLNKAIQSAWSPDGRMAYNRFALKENNLWWTHPSFHSHEGGEMVKRPFAEGKDPAWNPKHVSLLAYVRDGNVILNDFQEGEQTVAPGELPTWSADGALLFFNDRGTLKAWNPDFPDVPPREVFPKTGHLYAVISPDQTKVAFWRAGQLGVADIKSRKVLHQLDTPEWKGCFPGWSPDSQYVAFGSYGFGKFGTRILNVESGESAQLVAGTLTFPRWSPDGRYLSGEDRQKGFIVVYRLDDLTLP